ncbi:MAG: anthranilate phosphoribosyltransferase [Thaumarchaeota archaeon]|nr:anthranilate phosphoribosyltransferase [Nitrososphaerota archaeon]
MSIEEIVDAVCSGRDLDCAQAERVAGAMLDGETSHEQNARFLGCMSAKGETDAELASMLGVMMQRVVRLHPNVRGPIIDVCGTGGDMQRTFNVSTAASFVAAAASSCGPARDRFAVAKHGNRSSSGASGSADVFEALGYDNSAEPSRVQEILERCGICFLFAQRFHPAMRHVASARRALGKRTVFNLLGPLANPAGTSRQLVGVSTEDLLDRIPIILAGRGADVTMTVMSAEGMDELSTSSSNAVRVSRGADGGGSGDSRRFTVRPEEVGLHKSDISEIRVAGASESARAVVGAIDGTAGRAVTETAVFNAAGALVVAGAADSLKDAVPVCMDVVRSGRASAELDSFVRHAGSVEMLEGIRNSGA